jgi:hypothetical protein
MESQTLQPKRPLNGFIHSVVKNEGREMDLALPLSKKLPNFIKERRGFLA